MSPDTARGAAFAVIRRTLEHGAYADRALHAEARGLSGRDRALAKRLAFGAVQWRGSLDWLIATHVTRALDPEIRAALHLGLYQLLFTAVADHAAVAETVELVKANRGHRLVNAVLRRVQRDGPGWPADDEPAGAAIRHGHPEWIVRMWWSWLGREQTIALLEAGNRPAENALRVNTLAGVSEVDIPGRRDGETIVVDGPFDLFSSPLFRDGVVVAQSRASQMVAPTVDPQPGERVLDLCAAPGGKTTHLAALMQGRGRIVAVERHPGRAAALARRASLMGADCVEVVVEDATQVGEPGSAVQGRFDRVLVDPPCSGLGTLSGHPDLRWRVREQDLPGLAALQRTITDVGRSLLAPGGRLVYSTCTLSPAEEIPFREVIRTFPHRDDTDGFYIGRDG